MTDPVATEPVEEGEGNNRVTDPISNQEEADGLRASIQMRRDIPPAEITPVQEEAIALDEARLAQWDSTNPVPAPEEAAPEEVDDTEEADA